MNIMLLGLDFKFSNLCISTFIYELNIENENKFNIAKTMWCVNDETLYKSACTIYS